MQGPPIHLGDGCPTAQPPRSVLPAMPSIVGGHFIPQSRGCSLGLTTERKAEASWWPERGATPAAEVTVVGGVVTRIPPSAPAQRASASGLALRHCRPLRLLGKFRCLCAAEPACGRLQASLQQPGSLGSPAARNFEWGTERSASWGSPLSLLDWWATWQITK